MCENSIASGNGIDWRAAALLVAITLLGGWLRFSGLELMEFKGDEWKLHALAVRQAEGEFQWHGITSSVGINNPPMAVYLFALPAIFSESPLAAAALSALLGTLAILLTYALSRQWLGRPASLAAALLLAVSPWAILLSRKIWAQDLLPAFAAAFGYCVIRWHRTGRWHWAMATSAALAVLAQIHFSAIALIPIPLLVLWMRRSRKSLAQALCAAALFIALWTPFIVTAVRGEVLAEGQRTAHAQEIRFLQNFPRAMLWLGRLCGHGDWSYVLGASEEAFYSSTPQHEWLTAFWLTLLAGGAAAVCRVWMRDKQRADAVLLLAWILLPATMASFHVIHYHYLVIMWPAPFIVIVFAGERFWEFAKSRLNRNAVAAILIGALLLVTAENSVFQRRFHSFLSREGGTYGDYGFTYRNKLAIARAICGVGAEAVAIKDATGPRPEESAYLYLLNRMEYHHKVGRRLFIVVKSSMAEHVQVNQELFSEVEILNAGALSVFVCTASGEIR